MEYEPKEDNKIRLKIFLSKIEKEKETKNEKE